MNVVGKLVAEWQADHTSTVNCICLYVFSTLPISFINSLYLFRFVPISSANVRSVPFKLMRRGRAACFVSKLVGKRCTRTPENIFKFVHLLEVKIKFVVVGQPKGFRGRDTKSLKLMN